MLIPVIKNRIALLLIFFIVNYENSYSQVPFVVNFNSTSYSSGVQNYNFQAGAIAAPGDGSNVNISNTAEVHWTAGQEIQLKPGFEASGFTGAGNFHGSIITPAMSVMIMDPVTIPGSVCKYEKLEIGIDLPTNIDDLIALYFSTIPHGQAGGVNPFDPEDIDVKIQFRNSLDFLEAIDAVGFYYRDYSEDPANNTWVNNNTQYDFRVRVAPQKLGNWWAGWATDGVSVSSPNGKFAPVSSGFVSFDCNCTTPDNPGFLMVGSDKRHLKFSGTNQSFFGIGQNLPWLNRYLFDIKYNSNIFTLDEFNAFNDDLINLGVNHGNYTRILMAPWSHGIEWEQLGDYSDYIAQTGLAPGPVYIAGMEDRQQNAMELDKVFDICRQNGIYVDLNVEMHTGYNATGMDPIWTWNNNPYRLIPGVTKPIDLLTNATAIKYFKRKLRYIMARWGYSTNVAVIELLSELDKWEDYYYDPNDNHSLAQPASLSGMLSWHKTMAEYIKLEIPAFSYTQKKHLLSTSYARGPWEVFGVVMYNGQAAFDVTSAHKYGNGHNINHDPDPAKNVDSRFSNMNFFNGGAAVLGINGLLKDYDRPSIFGELGMNDGPDTGPPDHFKCRAGDIESYDDVGFHNDLWATAFMGCYGTGLNWWQNSNNAFRNNNFPALNEFFNDIDFEANDFVSPHVWQEIHLPINDYEMEVFSLSTSSGEKAIGWAHNASYWWGNISENHTDINGLYMPLPDDNDNPFDPVTLFSPNVRIEGLQMGINPYQVDWYKTTGFGSFLSTSAGHISGVFGRITVPFPFGASADAAFKAFNGASFHSMTNLITTDTLFCGEDSVYCGGIYKGDVDGTKYDYFWDFGNGQTSTLYHPSVTFLPGTYLTMFIATDSTGVSDTISQYIYLPDCNSRFEGDSTRIMSINKNNVISIVPNPNNGKFTIVMMDLDGSEYLLEILDMHGKMIYSTSDNAMRLALDLSSIENGLYVIKLTNRNCVTTKKFIKQ